MAGDKTTAHPGGGPVYSMRKGGVVCCQSSVPGCGYSTGMLKELRAAGYELYANERKVWKDKS